MEVFYSLHFWNICVSFQTFAGDLSYEQLCEHRIKHNGSLNLSICVILKFLNSTSVLNWKFNTYIMPCVTSLLLEGFYFVYY